MEIVTLRNGSVELCGTLFKACDATALYIKVLWVFLLRSCLSCQRRGGGVYQTRDFRRRQVLPQPNLASVFFLTSFRTVYLLLLQRGELGFQ